MRYALVEIKVKLEAEAYLWSPLRAHFSFEDEVTVRNPANCLARKGWRLASYRFDTIRLARG